MAERLPRRLAGRGARVAVAVADQHSLVALVEAVRFVGAVERLCVVDPGT